MHARTARVRSQKPRQGVGDVWIEHEMLRNKKSEDFMFSEEGLFVGTTDKADDSDDFSPISRFLLATLLIGVLLRLIGLIQYSGFTKDSKSASYKHRVSTLRAVSKAGSKLALGSSVSEVLKMACVQDNKRNLAFEIIEKLVSVFESEPLEGDDDPVAPISRFIQEWLHLDSTVSEDVRNTDADVFTSDQSEEFEVIQPRLVDLAETPPDRKYEKSLETVRSVYRLLNSQIHDPCYSVVMEVGHFPYYKKKGSPAIDYELLELSAVKLVLQRYLNIHYCGSLICGECHEKLTWYTPYRMYYDDDNPVSQAVSGLAVACLTPTERMSAFPLHDQSLEFGSHKEPDSLGPMLKWVPPWHPNHKICDKSACPPVLGVIGDTTFTRMKLPVYGPGDDPAATVRKARAARQG